MKTRHERIAKSEQLELFGEAKRRPSWNGLPDETRNRISELIASLLVDSTQTLDTSIDRKEVADE